MSNELPDLDESVSFVVDNGAPVGPIAMRTIINSIRSGVRAPDVLVWWAGATDWVPFTSNDGLTNLLSDLPATDQPPPPADLEADADADVDVQLTSVVDELESQIPDSSPGHLATTVIDMGMVEEAQALADEAAAEADGIEDVGEDVEAASDEVDLGGAVDDSEGVAEKFPDPEVITFGLVDDVDEDEIVTGDAFADADADADAEADALLAREPRDMHPSAVWGDDSSDDELDDTEVVIDELESSAEIDMLDEDADEESPAEALDADEEAAPEALDTDGIGDDGVVVGQDPADDISYEDPEIISNEEPEVVSSGGLTGLFSSPVRDDLDDQVDVEDFDAEGVSSRATLETVGARIDALSSATRRSQPFGLDDADADDESDSNDEVDPNAEVDGDGSFQAVTEDDWFDGADEASTGVEETDQADDSDVHAVDSEDETDIELDAEDSDAEDSDVELDGDVEASYSDDESAVDAPDDTEFEDVVQPTGGSWQSVDEDPVLDDRFARMVQVSNSHQRRLDWVLRVDELLMDACVGSIVGRGFVLLDLDGLDVGQRAVFDRHGDSQHIRLSLEPLSPVIAGEPIDRHVKVTMSWGRDVADADAAFATLRAEATDGETPPGGFTSDVNMVSSSATTSVDLIWLARDFVTDDHTVDRPEIDASITAILHALERRWYELFTAAD